MSNSFREQDSRHLRALAVRPLLFLLLILTPAIAAQNQFASDTNSRGVSQQNLLADDSLEGWEVTNFGGETTCRVKDGVLTIAAGYPLNGVTRSVHDFPDCDYEISLGANRLDGRDFFCGLTFPYRDTHATLIVGGWGGSIVGISSVDGRDASENETRVRMKFQSKRWYKIRLRVTTEKISAWIDAEQVIDFNPEGHQLTVRAETLPSRPLGICTFETVAGIRNVILKPLKPPADES